MADFVQNICVSCMNPIQMSKAREQSKNNKRVVQNWYVRFETVRDEIKSWQHENWNNECELSKICLCLSSTFFFMKCDAMHDNNNSNNGN